MSREEALATLRRLGLGLDPDQAGCSRLLERVAAEREAEALRDALVELGVEALLDARP